MFCLREPVTGFAKLNSKPKHGINCDGGKIQYSKLTNLLKERDFQPLEFIVLLNT
jgi:hypothetical protein